MSIATSPSDRAEEASSSQPDPGRVRDLHGKVLNASQHDPQHGEHDQREDQEVSLPVSHADAATPASSARLRVDRSRESISRERLRQHFGGALRHARRERRHTLDEHRLSREIERDSFARLQELIPPVLGQCARHAMEHGPNSRRDSRSPCVRVRARVRPPIDPAPVKRPVAIESTVRSR